MTVVGEPVSTGPRYAFRPIEKSELPWIGNWLARPHVCLWWGDPAKELQKIRDAVDSPGITGYLVLLSDRPFAYLQCYDLGLIPRNPFPDQPDGTRGIDLLIGEDDCLGIGHGSALLIDFTNGLLSQPSISRVIADPHIKNLASIGAFENAGFLPDGEREMPWGPVLLMVREANRVTKRYLQTRERMRELQAKPLRKLKHPSRSRKLRSLLDT